MTGGELPEDGVEEGARAVLSLAGALSQRRRPEEARTALEDAIMVCHDLPVHMVIPRDVAGEVPTVGGDDDRRLTADKVVVGVRGDEGLKKRPLVIGEICSQTRVVGWEG